MAIIWRPQMSVGNDIIDLDHRYLLAIINMVELSLRYNDDFFDTALDLLVEYTHDHFNREEKIQLKIKYPEYADHKLEHQKLLSTLAEIVGHLKKLNAQPKARTIEATAEETEATTTAKLSIEEYDKEVDELIKLLRSWIVDHVLGLDMKMKPYMTNV